MARTNAEGLLSIVHLVHALNIVGFIQSNCVTTSEEDQRCFQLYILS
jgi:hypothetical protein